MTATAASPAPDGSARRWVPILLDRRGMGEVHTMTAAEHRVHSPLGRLRHRVHRHLAFLFGLAPAWVFLVQNRLPAALHWITANTGLHHVHHLNSRIPFYRLPAVLRDHPELGGDAQRLTLAESLRCARLTLWDEDRRRLVTLREGLAPA